MQKLFKLLKWVIIAAIVWYVGKWALGELDRLFDWVVNLFNEIYNFICYIFVGIIVVWLVRAAHSGDEPSSGSYHSAGNHNDYHGEYTYTRRMWDSDRGGYTNVTTDSHGYSHDEYGRSGSSDGNTFHRY